MSKLLVEGTVTVNKTNAAMAKAAAKAVKISVKLGDVKVRDVVEEIDDALKVLREQYEDQGDALTSGRSYFDPNMTREDCLWWWAASDATCPAVAIVGWWAVIATGRWERGDTIFWQDKVGNTLFEEQGYRFIPDREKAIEFALKRCFPRKYRK